MSNFLINQTVEELGISSLKIYYDFENCSGQVIESIPSGNSNYSGEIINYNNNFTGSSSGSGFFDGQYILINNTEDIISESATIIFSQKKTGSSNGVIFSHLDKNGPSGWEVGINEANNFYFKHFVNGTAQYDFLDCYMADQNMCAVSVAQDGRCKLHRLNFAKRPVRGETDRFLSENDLLISPQFFETDYSSFSMDRHTISNGSEWRVGSGEFLYRGYLDKFLYFDQELADDQIRQFMNSFYSDIQYIPEVSGTISGEITGYNKIVTPVTGFLGNVYSGSGEIQKSGNFTYEKSIPQTGTVGISGEIYIPYKNLDSVTGTDQVGQGLYRKVVNLTYSFDATGGSQEDYLRDFESSGSYWHFSGNSGTFSGNSAIGAVGEIFGITGFETVTVTGYTSGYKNSGQSLTQKTGVLYNEYSYQPLYSPTSNYLVSEGFYSGDRSEPNPLYFPNEMSLLAQVEEESFYEILYDIYDANKINYYTKPQQDSFFRENFTFYIEDLANPHQLQVAINGVSQTTGIVNLYKNEFNLPKFNIDNGFYLTGSKVLTTKNLNESDDIIYDITYSGDKQKIKIESTDDYTGAPFTNFNLESGEIFFNGIKIYSGIDFVDNGGFYPSGNITGMTGVYFSYPSYKDSVSFTGMGEQPITIQHEEMMPDGFVVFRNGVRQRSNMIIQHAKNSDLISGTKVLNRGNKFFTLDNGTEEYKQ